MIDNVNILFLKNIIKTSLKSHKLHINIYNSEGKYKFDVERKWRCICPFVSTNIFMMDVVHL